MIKRNNYLEQIREFYNSDLIKIIITNDKIDSNLKIFIHQIY